MNASFGSQVRMPSDGGPLATMGKNEAGSINAVLHTVRFLAIAFPELKDKLSERMQQKAKEVEQKDVVMEQLGARAYLLEQANSRRKM